MSATDSPSVGSIVWRDLTVPHAEDIRDFYQKVVGWATTPISMGDYDDFEIKLPHNQETIAGICHARGANAHLPPQWLMYISVADVAASAQRCIERGGKILDGPRPLGNQPFCVIQDPAGAALALVGPSEDS